MIHAITPAASAVTSLFCPITMPTVAAIIDGGIDDVPRVWGSDLPNQVKRRSGHLANP